MKVLLTGATGFLGSHILDTLRARDIATVLLLRPGSDRRFIATHLPRVEVRTGSLGDPESLDHGLEGVTHVIHCAGLTKALRIAQFQEVNQLGTRHVVGAVNRHRERIRRLVHISSLAAAGPASADRPAREEHPPRPVSAYGHSKLAGEQEVQQGAQTEFVILRPPAVYGPRDVEFLRLFRAVQAHLQPRVGGGRQSLSLTYAKDLAEVVVTCLTHPSAVNRVFHVAAPEVVTTRVLAEEIATQLHVWTVTLPLPTFALWLVCCLQETVARLTGRPSVLSRQKYAELRAPGWVCDPTRLRQDLGLACSTRLQEGIAQTVAWYRQQGWLRT